MTEDIEATDAELVRRVKEGDRSAVDALFRRHWSTVVGYAMTLTHQRATAEDLASEAFLKMWVAMRSGRTPEKPRSYVCQSVRNLHIDQLRRARFHTDLDPTDETQRVCPPAPDHAEHLVEREALKLAVLDLTPAQRSMLWETAVEGYSTAEAAVLHGLPTSNAGAALATRARRTLGRAYARQAG